MWECSSCTQPRGGSLLANSPEKQQLHKYSTRLDDGVDEKEKVGTKVRKKRSKRGFLGGPGRVHPHFLLGKRGRQSAKQ